MHLRESEKVLAVIHRHTMPFVGTAMKIAVIFVPFYVLAYFIANVTKGSFGAFLAYFIVSLLFGLMITHAGLVYFLDKLIITNFRIVFVNWVTLLKRVESEADLNDIQDIVTREHGFLSHFRIFDFGNLEIETAASKTTIVFDYAPDPERIKNFLKQYIKGHI